MSKECADILKWFDWPGNIRELEQVIKEIILKRHADNDRSEISESELPDDILNEAKKGSMQIQNTKKASWKHTNYDEEIIHWMKELGNNKTRVAEQLGVTYKTIWLRCKN